MTRTPRSDRLTVDDALFETMRRVLETPVVSQTVWRFHTPLDRERLERFHAGLQRGPLARRLVRSRVPGARDHWVRANLVSPLILGDPISDLGGWIAFRAAARLSPEDGPAWELAYAPMADGGSALSFVNSHVVADGTLKLRALAAAASGDTLPVLPSEGAAVPRRRPGGLRAELRDRFTPIGGAGLAVPALFRHHPDTGSGTDVPERPDDDASWTPPVVVVDVPVATWQRTASADGGSANALLLALCAEIAVRAGRAAPGETVTVASPVSTRTDHDLRSNASTGVSVPVRIGADGHAASLAEVRASARAAYAALASRGARADPLTAARGLLPHLPAGASRRFAASWPAPLVLASDLGTLPPSVLAPTGAPATSVLNRSTTPPTTRGAARSTSAGLSAWWGSTGTTATLGVAGADPDAFPDPPVLQTHVEAALTDRGLARFRVWS